MSVLVISTCDKICFTHSLGVIIWRMRDFLDGETNRISLFYFIVCCFANEAPQYKIHTARLVVRKERDGGGREREREGGSEREKGRVRGKERGGGREKKEGEEHTFSGSDCEGCKVTDDGSPEFSYTYTIITT